MSAEYPIEILNADNNQVLLNGNICFTDPDKVPGARWFDGGGAPTDNYGVDGDYYLDDDTGTVYRKDGGTWA